MKPASADHPFADRSTSFVLLVFGSCSLITLAAGFALEESGSVLAGRWNLQGAIFGATALAAVSALPEVSTGIAAIRLGDNLLATADIFGGNAFQVCLFLLADLVAGRPVLASAKPADLWMGALGVLVTVVYGAGILLRPERRHARLGLDSITAITIYGLGLVGLAVITHR